MKSLFIILVGFSFSLVCVAQTAVTAHEDDAITIGPVAVSYSIVVGVGSVIDQTMLGSYDVIFADGYQPKRPMKDCQLIVHPLRRLEELPIYFGPDSHFFYETKIESHCGWKKGTIHAALLKAIEEGEK